MLPHVKYDKFEVECRQKIQDMKSCVEVMSCPCTGEMVSVNGPIVSHSQGVVEETNRINFYLLMLKLHEHFIETLEKRNVS